MLKGGGSGKSVNGRKVSRDQIRDGEVDDLRMVNKFLDNRDERCENMHSGKVLNTCIRDKIKGNITNRNISTQYSSQLCPQMLVS